MMRLAWQMPRNITQVERTIPMSEKEKFDVLCERISMQVGPPTFTGGEKQKPELNQQFFARFVAEVYNPIFEKTEGVFYLYEPETGLWVRHDEAAMIDLISLLMKRFVEETSDSFIQTGRNVSTIKSILKFMQADACCGRENAFARRGEPFIHCGNGVITFPIQEDGRREPVLVDFSPDFMSRNRTEIKFRKDAVCDEFLNRLLKPAISEDDINHFQQYFGQCVLGVNTSQTFVELVGTAGGGKSTVVNVIEKVVNRQNCTELRLEHMGSRFEMQRLVGKTLLTAKDVPSDFLATKSANKVKALSGKDTVSIERKGSNEVSDICGEFNIIITANTTLRIALDGDADAWRRRLILIEYKNPPPKEKIANFDDYLLAHEGDGILAWAVEGAMLLLENGGKIKKSERQMAKIDNLLHESDILAVYVANCIEKADPFETVTSAELLTNFRDYCGKRGWGLLPRRKIESNLPDYIYCHFGLSKRTDVKRNGKNNRGYYGLRIKK